jgi:CheY-like chemotaxis protein
MGLKGRLEDLPLLDMLQIIAFSRKSGFLRIAASKGRGAVVLKEGRVLFSYSWSTLASLEELVRDPNRITPDLIREQIEVSLRELGSLREGHFQFELADPDTDDFGGIRIQPFLLPDGLDAQELLLDLAVEIDNERREATSLLELAFQGDSLPEAAEPVEAAPPAPAPPAVPKPAPPPAAAPRPEPPPSAPSAPLPPRAGKVTVVLVDDEALVREVVGEELSRKGLRVVTASSPGSGANVVRERVQAGERVLVVVDLKMPTSSERSFFGGFELVRRARRIDAAIPVLLMTETLSDKAKARARELGIRRLVFKPTLSKIDRDLYVTDLREFAGAIHAQLDKLIEDEGIGVAAGGNGRSREGGDAERVDFLATMTRKLVEPGASTDVSRLVMEVAHRFLERGVLFVVKGDTARGLAAFGVARGEQECAERAQRVAIEISQCAALAEAVRRGSCFRFSEEIATLKDNLYEEIGVGRAREAVLLPLLFNRVTLLLLYGDNGASGQSLGELSGLELFMAQAGMALENKLLQRKLNGVESGQGDIAPDAHA